MTAQRATLGRYDLRGAREPANGFGDLPATRNVEAQTVAVVDPFDPSGRVLVHVNTRTDLLEKERSQGFISEGAYHAGRELQSAVERLTHVGGGGQWSSGDRVDAATRTEDAIAHGCDRIRKTWIFLRKIEWVIGVAGTTFLVHILCDKVPFVAFTSKPGARATAQVAAHFRLLLEALADGLAAKGKRRLR